MEEPTPGPENGWELIAENMSEETYHSIVDFQNANKILFQNQQSHPVHTVAGWIVCHLIAKNIKDHTVKFSYSNELYQLHLLKYKDHVSK